LGALAVFSLIATPAGALAARPAVAAGPGIAVTLEPDRREAYPRDQVNFRVTLINTGTTRLDRIVVTTAVDGIAWGAPTPDGCERDDAGALELGASLQYSCVAEAPTSRFSYGVRVAARTPSGGTVRDRVRTMIGRERAALTTTLTAAPGPYRPGAPIQLKASVRNTGEALIREVRTAIPTLPACARPHLGELAPGTERHYECTAAAPPDDTAGVLVAAGVPHSLPAVRSVSRSVPINVVHPAVTVAASRDGDGLDVTVVNVGDLTLANVRTTAAGAPTCARPALGTLTPGAVRSYRCAGGSGPILVTGTASTGPGADAVPPDAVIQVADAVQVPVGEPSLTVTQRLETPWARPGEPVSYEITARNIGTAPLRRVVLRDQLFAGCGDVELGAVAAGGHASYRCTVPAPIDDVTHVAVADGELADGAPVRAVSEPARLEIVRPGLAVTVAAVPEAAPGAQLRWSIAVRNVGDTDLRSVFVDAGFDGCDQRIGRLKVGAEPAEFSCTTVMETSTVTNAVTVTGRFGAGGTVTAVGFATVAVHDGAGLGGPGAPSGGATPQPSPGVPASPVPSLPPSIEPTPPGASPSAEPSPTPFPEPPPSPSPTP
jgi:uncharacterized repeat protein (TIGR01451 family)